MSKMTLKLAEAIKEIVEEVFNVEVEIHESYSGRFMYGSDVVAFASAGRRGEPQLDAGMIGYALGILESDDPAGVLEGHPASSYLPTRSDSLGLGSIFY
jgi:hypothetical protein